ncbi:MAG: ImmA/IrrE family metallo-endopeptidase [Bacillota bacterium]|nr:ImmA/IrrE family metallo-endopeptidase [Bacillota bacterium]
MGVCEIIELAHSIKSNYGNDPFYLCSLVDIIVLKTDLNPNIYPAYTTNVNGYPIITINRRFSYKSQKILCAHELGHAILHKDNYYNGFGDNDIYKEYEANLFAVSLLFDKSAFNLGLEDMSNYELQNILEDNLKILY